ncbi:MAG: hypothetical protein E7629_01490 [Ruminococcaceae bacterium]|nr:hypothetical protein [Oscillospiraceae bacterium]
MIADSVLFFLRQTVLVFLEVLGIAFFVRAILSWFDPMGEWRVSGFLYVLTEPITVPVRILCERMNWFQGVPMDIPYTLTWLLLVLAQVLLSVL